MPSACGHRETPPAGTERPHDEYDESTVFEAALRPRLEARLEELALVIAHVGGVPLEEILASVTGAGAGLLLARAWLMLRLRRRREPGK